MGQTSRQADRFFYADNYEQRSPVVEPFSVAAGGAILLAAGKKVFGATLDSMSVDVQKIYEAWSKPRVANLSAILSKVEARGIDDDGEYMVHPRIIHELFEEGTWIDDEVAQQYFAGLLVSSRSRDPYDDHGVFYARIISGMSANQIRMHHAIYHAYATESEKGSIVLLGDYGRALWMETSEAADVINVLPHDPPGAAVDETLAALGRDGLLASSGVGTPDEFRDILDLETSEDSSYAAVTALGVRLFLWAYGIRTTDPLQLLAYDWQSTNPIGPTIKDVQLKAWDFVEE